MKRRCKSLKWSYLAWLEVQLLLTAVDCYVLPVKTTAQSTRRDSMPLFVSYTEMEVSTDLQRSQEQLGRTLYQVLGASQSDTRSELRRRYRELARQVHPDASKRRGDGGAFSEVSQAWSILGDPKKRRHYDRSLKANEITETLEQFMEAGLRKAVPFFFQTAKVTRTALETSSHVMQEMGQRLTRHEVSPAIEEVVAVVEPRVVLLEEEDKDDSPPVQEEAQQGVLKVAATPEAFVSKPMKSTRTNSQKLKERAAYLKCESERLREVARQLQLKAETIETEVKELKKRDF